MPTIYLIGDSTVENGGEPFRGWGCALGEYAACPVDNRARGGYSSRSFRDEGLFAPMRDALAPGDALLIQFGHNDEKDDPARHTDPEGGYPAILGEYCDAALASGALPVLFTPVCRRYFLDEGSLLYTHGEYPSAVRRLAREKNVPLCDLQRASRALYLALGPEETAKLFVRLAPGEHPDFPAGHDDRTHFNAVGARRIAALAAELMAKDPRCRPYIHTTKGKMI
jgi:lysophospholipase L1-like esterase